MTESLDQYIRKNNIPNVNMSLDEYIHMNNIKKPAQRNGDSQHDNEDSGVSKFDRYRNQDEDDMDEDDLPMPNLVPYVPKVITAPTATQTAPLQKTKSIHERLGKRESVCESIHTSQMQLYRRPKFKAKQSVQNRLGKHWVNPASVERNRITVHALNAFAKNATRNMLANDDVQGQLLLNAFSSAIEREAEKKVKYDMKIQKEISSLQGKSLLYGCPGGLVISSDGPGISGMVKVPQHSTDMSLNQRFA